MDETLRVKIVAETSQATSSMKQLNKETQGLSGNTSAVSTAVNQLDKALNSVGFRAIRINAIANSFKSISASAKQSTSSIRRFSDKIKSSFSALRNFKTDQAVFDNLGKKIRQSNVYLMDMERKSPEAAKKIKDAFKALSDARNATNKSKGFVDMSGLRKAREAVESLATSRNKYIRDTFKDTDFASVKQGLLNAAKAGVKGAKKEYQDALSGVWNTLGKATEKNSLLFMVDNFYNKAKLAISGVVNLAKGGINLIVKAVKTLGKILKGIFVGGAIGVIIGAIAAVKNALDVSKLGDDIDKTSQKVGMTTGKFQKWAYVLERCGIETSQLKSSMRALTRNSMGNNASYFKQLGIDPSKMSQEQLFESTVKALQGISDSSERARMAYKLFGQSSAELAPLLAISSAEVQRLSYQYDLLGATMSGKVVRASADLQDALTDMRAAFQGLKNTLAQAIIPLVTKVVVRITVLIAKVNMILQALFGVELEYNDVAESTETVTHNTNETVKAVKKLKTLISGFDELNIFPSQDNGADIGGMLDDLADYGSDVAPVIGNILPPEAIAELENFRDNILPGIIEKIEKWKEAWEKIKESFNEGNFGDVLKILGETFDSPFLTGLGDAVQWVIDRVKELEHWLGDVKLVGWELPDSWNEFWGVTDKPWGEGKIDWEHLLGLDYDYENSPMGKLNAWILKIMDEADNTVRNTWEKVSTWFKQKVAPKFTLSYWQEKFKPIKDAWEQGGWLGVLQLVWGNIKQWFSQNVAPKFTLSYWQNKFSTIKTAITNTPFYQTVSGVWNSISGWWKSTVEPRINNSAWKKKFDSIIAGIKNTPIYQTVSETWNKVKDFWTKNLAPKFTIAYWKDKWNTIANGLGYASIRTKIEEKWKEVKSWWDKNVAAKFTWTYWRDKFNSIKTGLSNVSLVQAAKNMINGLISTLETGLNRIVDKINGSGIIGALKNIGVNIQLNRVYIPRLAKGGIIDSPTTALMGEYAGAKQNPEIVTPENKMREVFESSNDDVVNVLVQGFRQIIQAIDEKDTTVQIGDTTIAKSAARGNNQYRLQTGQSLF